MDLNFNNLDNLMFNGNSVEHLYFNNVLVWEKTTEQEDDFGQYLHVVASTSMWHRDSNDIIFELTKTTSSGGSMMQEAVWTPGMGMGIGNLMYDYEPNLTTTNSDSMDRDTMTEYTWPFPVNVGETMGFKFYYSFDPDTTYYGKVTLLDKWPSTKYPTRFKEAKYDIKIQVPDKSIGIEFISTSNWTANVESKEYVGFIVNENEEYAAKMMRTPFTLMNYMPTAQTVYIKGTYATVNKISSIQYCIRPIQDGGIYRFTPITRSGYNTQTFTIQPGYEIAFMSTSTAELTFSSSHIPSFASSTTNAMFVIKGNLCSLINFSNTIPSYGFYATFRNNKILQGTLFIGADTISNTNSLQWITDSCPGIKTMYISASNLPTSSGYLTFGYQIWSGTSCEKLYISDKIDTSRLIWGTSYPPLDIIEQINFDTAI